jgi:hypothetical protein
MHVGYAKLNTASGTKLGAPSAGTSPVGGFLPFALRSRTRQLHTKYRTFFAIESHVLGRCRLKPDRRLTVAKTATLSQLKHLLGSGRIAYRSISPSSRSSSRPVNPMIVLSLAPFDRRGENSDDENARRIFVKARSSRGA